MKKTKFFLGLFLGIVLGVGIAVVVYFLTVGQIAWEQYIEEKLVPAVTAGATALLLIWFGVKPTLKMIISATSLFNQATDNVKTTVENGAKANSSLEEYKAELSRQFTEAVAAGVSQMKEQDERIKNIEQHTTKTEEIVRIAFGNMTELVVNGYAAEIAKVGTNHEETEK